jgi:hypothetical protein
VTIYKGPGWDGRALAPLAVAAVIALGAGAGAGYWAGSRAEAPPRSGSDPGTSLRAELDSLAERLTALERALLLGAVEDAAGSAQPSGEGDGEAPAPREERERAGAAGDEGSRGRFGGFGGQRWMESLDALRNERDPQKRRELARQLARSPIPPLRLEGFRTLLELDADEGLAMVREMVADAGSNPRAARMAAQAIALLGDVSGSAVDGELYAYAQSPAFDVQRSALRTLERRGDPEPIRASIATRQSALQSPDAGTRSRALREVGSLRSPSAMPVIVPLLADADSGVRIQALEALSRTGSGDAALAAVEPLLSDPVPAVRDTAVRTQERLRRGDAPGPRGGFGFGR